MNKQALIEFTQKLVRQQSLSGEEGPVTQIVVDEMRALSFDKVWVDENGSAIGVVEGMQPGKTVLFDAHTDTVGIAPGSVWTKDPFGGEIIDSYLYGRGSADMKGALAAMVHAAANVDKGKLAGRVVVSASVLEEVYEGGALKTVMNVGQSGLCRDRGIERSEPRPWRAWTGRDTSGDHRQAVPFLLPAIGSQCRAFDDESN